MDVEKKKIAITTILKKIRTYRPLADMMIVLMNNKLLDEKALDVFIKIVSESLKEIKNEKAKKILNKAISQLESMREIEKQPSKKDQQDAEKMLEGL